MRPLAILTSVVLLATLGGCGSSSEATEPQADATAGGAKAAPAGTIKPPANAPGSMKGGKSTAVAPN